ncbi:cytochrome P450 [Nocardioides terrisoli]|uniref:cytochrome P450 n=1 Tax=Nocardioides terrisoli TaxID=3388267 RepID=UPI00287B7D27|nr:cytochrome P450 [Nocardioides marmorisolisilvae]
MTTSTDEGRFFDLGDLSFDVTAPVVHEAREADWYVRTNYGFAVLRYAEANAILKDRRFCQGTIRWPDQNGVHTGPFHDWWGKVLLSLEGADHTRIRRLLFPAFKQRPVAAMAPRFQRIATDLIDGFAARGEVELVSEFAEPYSSRIICGLLGLPDSEWSQVAHWADDLGKSFGVNLKADLPRIEGALTGLYGYVDQLVADRTAHPTDDLVSQLIAAQQAERLSAEELGVALVFLVFAGMETTRNQLTLALQTFFAHPDQWRLLGERPELGRNAVEEIMRVNPTVTWITREALEDVEINGLVIPKGGIVQLLSHATGTDPRAMEETGFDITSPRPMHMGFGGGVHHCLGHFVARIDMAVALPLLAMRMPDARPDGPGEWLPVSGNTGAIRFPIRFTPETRRPDPVALATPSGW